MLELIDVHSSYGDSTVLRGVSFKVESGSVVALLGRNGMGKTTCVHTIMGLLPARKGKISFKGADITDQVPHKISRMGLALVPQGRRIFPSLSVKENLVIGMRGKGFSLDEMYEQFPVLKKRAGHKGNQLSGGEQQMLAIARALMSNSDLVVMDEPSEGLAPLIVQEVSRTIRRLKSMNLSILLVEQNIHLALGVADYVYIINKGIIEYQCEPDELRNNEEVKGKYLGVSGGEMTCS